MYRTHHLRVHVFVHLIVSWIQWHVSLFSAHPCFSPGDMTGLEVQGALVVQLAPVTLFLPLVLFAQPTLIYLSCPRYLVGLGIQECRLYLGGQCHLSVLSHPFVLEYR